MAKKANEAAKALRSIGFKLHHDQGGGVSVWKRKEKDGTETSVSTTDGEEPTRLRGEKVQEWNGQEPGQVWDSLHDFCAEHDRDFAAGRG